MRRLWTLCAWTLASGVIQTVPLVAQGVHHDASADTACTVTLFPRNPAPYRFACSAGISLAILPRLIVEEEVRQEPTLDVRVRYGLPYDLAAELHLNIVYVANQATLGLAWTHSFEHFSFGLHDDIGLWYGAAGFQGFDAYGIGLLNFPAASIGVNYEDFYISFHAEILVQLSQKTVFGGNAVRRSDPQIAGMAYTLAMEQDLIEGHRILWGVRLNYALPQYQLWLAFSDTRVKTLIPEFFIAYIF